MKGIGKLTALFCLNVILALTAPPQTAKAGEVCAECITWYAYVCGYTGSFVHTFDHDPPDCEPDNPQEEGVSYGDYDADHATVYASTCNLHDTCEGGGIGG